MVKVPGNVHSPVLYHYPIASENAGLQMVPLQDLKPFLSIPVLVLKNLLGTSSQSYVLNHFLALDFQFHNGVLQGYQVPTSITAVLLHNIFPPGALF